MSDEVGFEGEYKVIPTVNEDNRINKIALALSQAQGEFLPIHKNVINPFLKKKYADLDSVLEATKPSMTKYKIAHVFTMGDGFMTLSLIHESGQSLTSKMKFNENQKAQDIGKDMTYYRRYLLSAMLNVAADDDDDGNNAKKKEPYSVKQFESNIDWFRDNVGSKGADKILASLKAKHTVGADLEKRIREL